MVETELLSRRTVGTGGFRGNADLTEVLPITDELEEAIDGTADEARPRRAARLRLDDAGPGSRASARTHPGDVSANCCVRTERGQPGALPDAAEQPARHAGRPELVSMPAERRRQTARWTPVKAGDTTRENPWPVRALAQRMSEYVAKAPAAWVEGQLAQVSMRSGSQMSFLTLRDPSVSMSLSVVCSRTLLTASPRRRPRARGWWCTAGSSSIPARGSLSFKVDQIHPVGLGELLARLERLRQLLAAEGLTAAERKKRLPFLPGVVGLITGRASAAESDVLANARARWPAVRFRVENPAVQGISAVSATAGGAGQAGCRP